MTVHSLDQFSTSLNDPLEQLSESLSQAQAISELTSAGILACLPLEIIAWSLKFLAESIAKVQKLFSDLEPLFEKYLAKIQT